MSAFELRVRQLGCLSAIQWTLAISKRISRAIVARFHSLAFEILTVSLYLTTIGTVAAYDIQLTIRYAGSLQELEQNPVGRWLMSLNRISRYATPDLTLFLMLKTIGTIAVLVAIIALVRWRKRVGHPVGLGVSAFQLWLAVYRASWIALRIGSCGRRCACSFRLDLGPRSKASKSTLLCKCTQFGCSIRTKGEQACPSFARTNHSTTERMAPHSILPMQPKNRRIECPQAQRSKRHSCGCFATTRPILVSASEFP